MVKYSHNEGLSDIIIYLFMQWYVENWLYHWPKTKLDRAVSGVWIGRHDQTALTSGRGKKQRWSGCASSFGPMNTDFYCDACIIILCVQTICIIPVLLYAMKYVNVLLCKSIDMASNVSDRPGVVEQTIYNNS